MWWSITSLENFTIIRITNPRDTPTRRSCTTTCGGQTVRPGCRRLRIFRFCFFYRSKWEEGKFRLVTVYKWKLFSIWFFNDDFDSLECFLRRGWVVGTYVFGTSSHGSDPWVVDEILFSKVTCQVSSVQTGHWPPELSKRFSVSNPLQSKRLQSGYSYIRYNAIYNQIPTVMTVTGRHQP